MAGPKWHGLMCVSPLKREGWESKGLTHGIKLLC
uniref:Uncharacterized protein n=1 Tax=Picea glauca TaxID=3330 RepID=A0A101LZV6_PICGL|nr:hypothetical protein ABT39_MTgene5330 [Picea glauca]